MATALPIEHHSTSPFRDTTFLASQKANARLLERRRKAIEIDVMTLQVATVDPDASASAATRIAYRLLVRCGILAAMNLTDCEGEALEDSFYGMRKQVDQGVDRLLAFQRHIDTVVAATHMSEPREVLTVVWQELAPFIRLLTKEHWSTFERAIAWCSAANIWDDRAQTHKNIRLLREIRRLIPNKTPIAD